MNDTEENNAVSTESIPDGEIKAEKAGGEVTPTPDAVPEISVEPEEAEPQPEVKTIELWVPPQFDPQKDTAAGKSLLAFVERFMNDNHNVRVNIRVKAPNGGSSALSTLSAAKNIAPDVVPSLVLLSRQDMESAAQKGLIQPIETGIFSDNASWYTYARQSAIIDNSVYGIPVAGDALILAYRVSKIGKDLSDWNDVLTRGMPIAFVPSSSSSIFGAFIYRSLGGKFTNDQGQVSLEHEKTTETLNFFLGGGHNGAFPPSLLQIQDQTQAWQRFNDGTVNLIISHYSVYQHYRTNGVKAIPIPTLEDSEVYPMATSWNWCLTETVPELQRIAVQFAEEMADPKYNDPLTIDAGFLPIRNTEHPLLTDEESVRIVDVTGMRGELIPGIGITTKICPVLNEAVVQIIKNALTPEAAAQEAISSFN